MQELIVIEWKSTSYVQISLLWSPSVVLPGADVLKTDTQPESLLGHSTEISRGKGLLGEHRVPAGEYASPNALPQQAEGMLLETLTFIEGSYSPPYSAHTSFHLCPQFYHTVENPTQFCVKKLSTCSTFTGSCALSMSPECMAIVCRCPMCVVQGSPGFVSGTIISCCSACAEHGRAQWDVRVCTFLWSGTDRCSDTPNLGKTALHQQGIQRSGTIQISDKRGQKNEILFYSFWNTLPLLRSLL